uniref:Uncharacterized protein n=1 Tax=Acanthochromis polyacanthus TaxID=80966 RepID=A0A3Q1FGS0_9TELE
MGDISDLDRQIEQLRRCELIKENEVKALCAKRNSDSSDGNENGDSKSCSCLTS